MVLHVSSIPTVLAGWAIALACILYRPFPKKSDDDAIAWDEQSLCDRVG